MARHSEAFRRWRHMDFPPGGFNDTLGDLKGELALRDGEVTDIALTLDTRGDDRDIVWPVIDLLAEVDSIVERLTTFIPADDDEANLQNWQLDYANALREVYAESLLRRTH